MLSATNALADSQHRQQSCDKPVRDSMASETNGVLLDEYFARNIEEVMSCGCGAPSIPGFHGPPGGFQRSQRSPWR